MQAEVLIYMLVAYLEFMEEEERLNGIESDKKAEVARLEEIYETRIRALGREIAVLKKKNEQLSVFAGKVFFFAASRRAFSSAS